MTDSYQIRADYDRDTLVVYQAYDDAIADPALAAQRFVDPFSFRRMTWIKPSFSWLMHRSNWGLKRGQTRVLAVRIRRSGWETALSKCVMTTPDQADMPGAQWRQAYANAAVHLQWDPERSVRGAALNHYSIQVGLSRHIIETFVNDWIVGIEDYTPRVRRMHKALTAGRLDVVRRHRPAERVYPLPADLRRRLVPFGR